jgi:hypothetical protein
MDNTKKTKTESRIMLTSGPVGSISRSHGVRSGCTGIRVSTALRARVSAYGRPRGVGSIRDLANAMGSASSVI